MVTVVCLINTLISILLLYVAWKVWHLRQTLAQVADNFTAWERNTHEVLQGAPRGILVGQQSIYQMRPKNKQPPPPQTQIGWQILSILRLGWKIRRQSKKLFPGIRR
jgi:hypothetical protein